MSKVELIAEVSSNHGGDLALAKEFIWRFAEAGADWVKFQHTRVKHLNPADPQYAWFQRAEFSCEQFAELKAECERAGTQFLTTVYNAADVPEVMRLGCRAIKIGSGEAASDAVLARAVLERAGLLQLQKIFVGLGLCHNEPSSSAVYREAWTHARDGSLHPGLSACWFLGCVTRYPAPSGCVSGCFSPWPTVGGTTGPMHIITGWSDHAVGIDECCRAVLCGALVIEKHVCLPQQARHVKAYEATVEDFKALRAFADEDPKRFIGRWQYA